MNLLKELIDTLICKALLATGGLDYPCSILPKNQYIARINVDQLCKDIPLVVIRRSDKLKQDTFNKFGTIREDVITRSDITGMSMSLLGGYFKIGHIRFNPTGEAVKIWNGYENVLYLKYLKSVHLLPVTTPIFFAVIKLHNIDLPYERNKDKDLLKIMNALKMNPTEVMGKLELHGKGYISHEPTRLNYWHVEFQIRDFENKLIEKAKSAWQKEAANSALLNIQTNALFECPDISNIPKSYFYK